MNIELLLAVNGFLTLILGITLKALSAIYSKRLDVVESAKDDHEKRIQKIEDVQNIKIDLLSVELGKMELKIDSLATQVSTLSQNFHKQKNEESQLVNAANGLLKFLERNEKNAK